MGTEEKKDLTIKFPEDQSPQGTSLISTPQNPVDKAADFLPRALTSIKENFREAVFLFVILGYIFVAALGHMERIQNYAGYFFVFVLSVVLYKLWDKVTIRDVLYLLIIIALIVYIIAMRFGVSFSGLI